jgi:hypothetical protein
MALGPVILGVKPPTRALWFGAKPGAGADGASRMPQRGGFSAYVLAKILNSRVTLQPAQNVLLDLVDLAHVGE